jgi:8-oxo-dGTP pyrophosphatase MutT (NUDIX family)
MKREFSAGGLVIRTMEGGRRYAVAVRVRKGVWALPKGHPDGEESPTEAARREVREEAGVEAEPVEKIGDVRYWYTLRGERVLKTVAFYLFDYRSGDVADHDHEVEEAAWVPLDELPSRLSYPGERKIAETALSQLGASR